MSHGSIVWNHGEVETCDIVIDEVWGDDCAEIEEVSVGLLDFRPNSLGDIRFHFVDTTVDITSAK